MLQIIRRTALSVLFMSTGCIALVLNNYGQDASFFYDVAYFIGGAWTVLLACIMLVIALVYIIVQCIPDADEKLKREGVPKLDVRWYQYALLPFVFVVMYAIGMTYFLQAFIFLFILCRISFWLLTKKYGLEEK